ncbi:MAG: hypothetical protein Q4F65_06660 [Propionibacteriaceae bacterium]|nr:hypothetical protein [Propionibacteriaceae bacterium]
MGKTDRTPVWLARRLGGVALLLSVLAGAFFLGNVLVAPGPVQAAFSHLWFLFDVGQERNIPSWYASVLWCALAGAAFAAAVVARRRRAGWVVFGGVAVAASIDEHSELHERLDQVGGPLAEALGIELWFTWVLPGVLIGAVIVAVLAPLVWGLPKRARAYVIAGGVLFALGAVVVEAISGQVLASFGGAVTWHYIAVTLVEETLEMIGVVVALAGVLILFEVHPDADGHRVIHWRGDD